MKAMVLEALNQELVYRDYPDPVITRDDDVIIKVEACGVCATDIKVMHGVVEPEGLPRILGHEPAGRVVAVGPGVSNVKIGDRVVSATYMTCHACEYCRSARETLCDHVTGRLGITVDGGFAEYMKLNAQCIVKIPDTVDSAEAAVLPCGAGVPYHALIKRMTLRPTDMVMVLGVGGVGIQAVQLIKMCGAKCIAVDLDEDKLALAKENGADYVVNTKDAAYLDRLREAGKASVLFDTVGLPKLLSDCIGTLKKGAKIVLVGYGPGKKLELDMSTIVLNELDIMGSRGVSVKDVEDLMLLLENGKIRPVVKRYPISQLNDIIDKIEHNQLVGRAVVEP